MIWLQCFLLLYIKWIQILLIFYILVLLMFHCDVATRIFEGVCVGSVCLNFTLGDSSRLPFRTYMSLHQTWSLTLPTIHGLVSLSLVTYRVFASNLRWIIACNGCLHLQLIVLSSIWVLLNRSFLAKQLPFDSMCTQTLLLLYVFV